MKLEDFVLKCPKCGNVMDLLDDDPEEPTWECSECRTGAWGNNGEINFVDFFGNEDYTYDEVYTYTD